MYYRYWHKKKLSGEPHSRSLVEDKIPADEVAHVKVPVNWILSTFP